MMYMQLVALILSLFCMQTWAEESKLNDYNMILTIDATPEEIEELTKKNGMTTEEKNQKPAVSQEAAKQEAPETVAEVNISPAEIISVFGQLAEQTQVPGVVPKGSRRRNRRIQFKRQRGIRCH